MKLPDKEAFAIVKENVWFLGNKLVIEYCVVYSEPYDVD